MSLFKWVEIAVITGIPLAIWWMQIKLQEQKEEKIELLKSIQNKINNRAIILEKKIDLTDLNINAIKDKLNHYSEINEIKVNFLKEKINDIESYLEKINGYRKKRNNYTEDNSSTFTNANYRQQKENLSEN
jgi:hypothetical protein